MFDEGWGGASLTLSWCDVSHSSSPRAKRIVEKPCLRQPALPRSCV